MRKYLLTFAALAALGGAVVANQLSGRLSAAPDAAAVNASALPSYAPQKAVYQFTHKGGWFGGEYTRVLNIMQNHVAALGPGRLDLRVVLSGEGLLLLKDARTSTQLSGMVDKLRQQGVRFLICNNTVVAKHLDPARDLYDVAPGDIVRAGIAEVASLQQQGFVYLNP